MAAHLHFFFMLFQSYASFVFVPFVVARNQNEEPEDITRIALISEPRRLATTTSQVGAGIFSKLAPGILTLAFLIISLAVLSGCYGNVHKKPDLVVRETVDGDEVPAGVGTTSSDTLARYAPRTVAVFRPSSLEDAWLKLSSRLQVI